MTHIKQKIFITVLVYLISSILANFIPILLAKICGIILAHYLGFLYQQIKNHFNN